MVMILLMVLAVICLIAGLLGTLYPVLPSLPLMLLGSWLLAFSQDYQVIGSWQLILLLIVAGFGMAMETLASFLGAKRTGASKTALWGAFIGGIVGMFLGILGIIFAPLLGAMVGEWYAKRDVMRAGKVGMGTFVGFLVGTATKIASALAMIFLLLFYYLSFYI